MLVAGPVLRHNGESSGRPSGSDRFLRCLVDRIGRMITVGLSPAWDITCRGHDLDWGRHAEIDEQVVRAAGKAMNVSAAMAWMGCTSTAAGLWGRDDYRAMRDGLHSYGGLVEPDMTLVDGRTRQNITVVDLDGRREMHLRQPSRLATRASLAALNAALKRRVRDGDLCVFAGAMPGGDLLDSCLALAETCRRRGGRIVADTYGPVLKGLVEAGLPWLIAPNVEEMGDLLGRKLPNRPAGLADAAGTLFDRVPFILLSRGRDGAVLATKRRAWSGRTTTDGEVLETVGCGDYLLAGFLAGYRRNPNARIALAAALKVATARAYGWTESETWPQVSRKVRIETMRL